MSDRPHPIHSAERSIRGRARLARARRRGLYLTGLTALALAAASSTAALLGTPAAPSLAFVAQCFTLGALSLAAPSVPRLRRAIPGLSAGAAALLVLCVALEVVRG
ncbi:hypothetical protein K2Z84_20690, partial [Candidatus Binatia bacterium]|nr:hypothetical protein [Candidatus Binatia bacterium]